MSQIFSISLGKGKISLTLEAQLADASGIDIGGVVTTGFVEIGNGNYIWNYDLDASFVGIVKFIDSSNDEVLAVTSVNPVELSSTGIDNIFVEDDVNLRQAMCIISAVLGGVINVGEGEVAIKAMTNIDITRVACNVNIAGERSNIVLNLPE